MQEVGILHINIILSRLKTGKYLHRVFFVYILLITIPAIILSLFSYMHLTTEWREEVGINNEKLVIQTSKAFDVILSQLLSMSSNISTDPNIIELLSFPARSNYEKGNAIINDDERLEYYYYLKLKKKVMDKFLIERFSNAYIENIYFLDISEGNVYSTDSNSYSIKSIIKKFPGATEKRTLLLKTSPIEADNQESVQFVAKTYDNKGVIIIDISLSKIYNMVFNSILGKEKTAYLVVDEKGKEIFSSEIPEDIDKNMILKNSGKSSESLLYKDKYAIKEVQLNTNNWYLIGISSLEDFQGKIRNTAFVFILTTFFCIMLFIIIAFIISKNLYKPIVKLKKQINEQIHNEQIHEKIAENKMREEQGNDIEVITEGVKEIISDRNEINKKFKTYLPIIKESMIHKLLINGVPIIEQLDFAEKIDEMHIKCLDNEVLLVSLIELRNVPGNLFLEKICELCGNITDQTGIAHIYNNRSIVLVTRHKEGKTKNLLYGNLEGIIKEINIKYHQDCIIGIGSYAKSLEHIKDSFIDAENCLKYKLVYGYNTIIDIESVEKQHTYSEVKVKECFHNIIYQIKSGKREDAFQLFNRLNAILLKECAHISILSYMKVMLGLIDSIIKAVGEQGDYSNSDMSEGNIFFEFINLKDKDELLLWYESFIGKAVSAVSNRSSQESVLIEKIKNYINENIQEVLSLQDIANRFGMNSSYISRLFSEWTKTTITEYIASVKVEIAKKLLAQEGMKIKDVAKHLGYISDDYFIKVFKKYAGVTPNKYKLQI